MFRLKIKDPNYHKRRIWSPTAMTNAYQMVREEGVSVYSAAKRHGIPLTTLRDRIDNRISIDVTKTGPGPVLSLEEEAKLCNHLKELAAVGYGYTRAEVINLASNYAVSLEKRSIDKPFTQKWFYGYMGRWPELKVVRPSSLSEQRARCASEEAIINYFNELERIMTKYNLKKNPQNIYNIDEKGINTEFKPPNVVSGSDCKPQAIMAERSKTVTIIGAGSAIGQQIPPYFVFPGIRMLDGLLEGKSPGADGVVTPSGWSNGEVFKQYLQNHFLKFCPGRNQDDTILILYDGHRSHVSLDLVEWAKANNIVLFVLPPHTSHILQPMDVGCFGPLQIKYAQECTKFARLNHRVVTRYDVCSLACKAYVTALSPINLQSAFSKSGIYPFKKAEEMLQSLNIKIQPSTLYCDTIVENEENVGPSGDATNNEQENEQSQIIEHENEQIIEHENEQVNEHVNSQQELVNNIVEDFFESRKGTVVKKVSMKKKRRNISTVIGGRALEGDTEKKMKLYMDESNKKTTGSKSAPPKKKKSQVETKPKKTSKQTVRPKSSKSIKSPQPGPSCFNVLSDSSDNSENETESDIPIESKCCKCKRFYVERDDNQIFSIVSWVQCENCLHWVHLKYCTPLRVARKDTSFTCDCCVNV